MALLSLNPAVAADNIEAKTYPKHCNEYYLASDIAEHVACMVYNNYDASKIRLTMNVDQMVAVAGLAVAVRESQGIGGSTFVFKYVDLDNSPVYVLIRSNMIRRIDR